MTNISLPILALITLTLTMTVKAESTITTDSNTWGLKENLTGELSVFSPTTRINADNGITKIYANAAGTLFIATTIESISCSSMSKIFTMDINGQLVNMNVDCKKENTIVNLQFTPKTTAGSDFIKNQFRKRDKVIYNRIWEVSAKGYIKATNKGNSIL